MTTKKEFCREAVKAAFDGWSAKTPAPSVSEVDALRRLLNETRKIAGEMWEMCYGPNAINNLTFVDGPDGLEFIEWKKILIHKEIEE